VNLPTLEDLHISEHAENAYAQIIAEEDIGEDYGTKAIIQERAGYHPAGYGFYSFACINNVARWHCSNNCD